MTNLAFLFLALFLSLLGITFLFFYKFYKKSSPEKDSSMLLLQQQMDGLKLQISQDLSKTNETVNQQLGLIVNQLQQGMDHVLQNLKNAQGQFDSRLNNSSKIMQDVSHQLGSLSQATERIFEATKNITTLEEILKPPKLRGGMGEILLENILREILPSRDFYELQYIFKNGNTVDALIRLKEGLIPIDAKFPLDNFRRMIETKNEKEQLDLRKEFVRNVKKHIDEISKKYILTDEGTLPFALMYIPAENVYYETIIRIDQPNETFDLYSYATQKHVFPVSPNSLYPYLVTLSLGFRGLKIEEQTKEILGELGRLTRDLQKFLEDFKLVGTHLNHAKKSFEDAEKKVNRLELKLDSLNQGNPEAPPKIEILE